ncbi:MAG: transcription elongation factor Spt5 [Methanomethylophilus sp.]|jgi:transcriptional antiterminator NusG
MSDEVSGPYFTGETGSKDVHAGGTVYWDIQASAAAPKAELTFTVATDVEDAPEWSVALYDSVGNELWENYRSKNSVTADFPGKTAKVLKLEIICPKGARYGDTVNVTVAMKSDAGEASAEFSAVAKQSIMILKTQMDHEKEVAQALIAKADKGQRDIYAVLSPIGLRGYVFVEGMNTDQLRSKTRDIKKAYSFIDGETSLEEIAHYLVPVSAVVGIEEGDLVELVTGPFKGETARVQKIDESKEEITVELVDAMVPIPVTVKADSVRVVEKEN